MADDFLAEHVLPCDVPGQFKIRSATDIQTWYTIRFDAPSCECWSWEHTHLPCKHFFAVFRHHPKWGWEKLPHAYRYSSILSLDEAVIANPTAFKLEDTSMYNTSPETASPETVSPETAIPETAGLKTGSHETVSPETAGPETVSPETVSPETASSSGPEMDAFLEVRKGNHRSIGSECREILSEIRNITFTVEDTDTELQGGAEVDAFDSPFQPAYCSLCMHHGS